MYSTLFLPAALQLTVTVLLAIAPLISATPSSLQLEPHSRGVVLPKGWGPMGCYSDNPTQPTLTSIFFTTLNGDMTVLVCTATCNGVNKHFAGLKNGTECFCGNVLTDGAMRILDSDCLVPCIGDNDQICGGTDSLSLYWSGAPPQAPPTMPQYVDSWKLMGCYDDSDSRTLSNPGNLMGGYYNNSAEHCIATCASGKYSAAGMKSAGECWCDNAIDERKEPIDPKFCMLACPANSLELCGGPNSTTVYANILP